MALHVSCTAMAMGIGLLSEVALIWDLVRGEVGFWRCLNKLAPRGAGIGGSTAVETGFVLCSFRLRTGLEPSDLEPDWELFCGWNGESDAA